MPVYIHLWLLALLVSLIFCVCAVVKNHYYYPRYCQITDLNAFIFFFLSPAVHFKIIKKTNFIISNYDIYEWEKFKLVNFIALVFALKKRNQKKTTTKSLLECYFVWTQNNLAYKWQNQLTWSKSVHSSKIYSLVLFWFLKSY